MPELEKNARDQLLLHQFLAGIPNAVSRQLRATGEIKTLNATVTRARLRMTMLPGVARLLGEKPGEVDVLKEQIALLTEQVERVQRIRHATRQTTHDSHVMDPAAVSAATEQDTCSVNVLFASITVALTFGAVLGVEKSDISHETAGREMNKGRP